MLAFALTLGLLGLAPQERPAAATGTTAAPTYDPLALPTDATPSTPLDLSVLDSERTRELPLRVWLPTTKTAAPVVLFSHGLGGSCKNARHLASHWSARGYVVVCMQHPGSDESVWRDAPLRQRMEALRDAASANNLWLRCGDVKAVLDQLARWQQDADSALHGRLDLDHVGMSGHSFGAMTTQAVAGQWAPLLGRKHTDARIDAALALSPSAPKLGDLDRAFGSVTVPWCLMTGTRDDSPIGGQTAADRRRVYPALPATIDRYELVLHDALHSAFADALLPGERGNRNPNHHRVVLALSTAFWDTHLRGDAAARRWLHGDDGKRVLEANDVWQLESAVRPGDVR